MNMKTLNIVIPMGGHGSRFTKAGYNIPKPLIEVAGKTMIEQVINNLKPSVPHRFIFVCQEKHFNEFNLDSLFKRVIGEGLYKVVFDEVIRGAAYGVLLAKEHIDNDDDLLVANSDQYIETNIDDFINDARDENTEGLIMTFTDSDPKWSFAKLDGNGLVIETAEKVPISDHATVGIYYFSKGRDFIHATEVMIEKNLKHNGEFYVCPVYNEIIAKKGRVRIHDIPMDKMHGLGTPEDLHIFLDKVRKGEVVI